MQFFAMSDHVYAVFAEKRGSGTYIRIVVLARPFFPEGFEKYVFYKSTIIQNARTGRIAAIKADEEVPEDCTLLHKKGDLKEVQKLEFGNKNASFAKSKSAFEGFINDFKAAFRAELEAIGQAKEPGFYFPKARESKISKFALATKHAACVTNDVLNYAEKKIKEIREKLHATGVENADEKVYQVYIYFYNKVKQFVQTGEPVCAQFIQDVFIPDVNGIRISMVHTLKIPYFFSLVAKYARKGVYENLANFLLDLEFSLQALLDEITSEKRRAYIPIDELRAKTEEWKNVVEHIRPRIVQMRQKLDEREFKRINTGRRFIINKEDDEEEICITWEDFEKVESGEEFVEEESEEIPQTVFETSNDAERVRKFPKNDDITSLFSFSLFNLEVLKQE